MSVAAVGLAFLRLVLAIVFAMVALYIAAAVLNRLLKGVDLWAELGKGNVAMGILTAGIFISVAAIVAPGVAGLFKRIAPLPIVLGFVQLVIAIGLAVAMQYLGLWVFGKLTREIEEWEELKKGNVAIGVAMAAIVIAVAVVVTQGVATLIEAVFA